MPKTRRMNGLQVQDGQIETLSNLIADIPIKRLKVAKSPSAERTRDHDLYILREKKLRRRNTSPFLRNKKAFRLEISMLSAGSTYVETAEALNKISGFRTSKTSVGRFWNLYKRSSL